MAADLAVVGGGLAGRAAALAAADADPDADVRLVANGDDSLAESNGVIDVLGYLPSTEGPVREPLEAIERLPDSHPYRALGTGGVRGALAWFDDLVGDRYAGTHTDRNALLPTPGGTVAPAVRYPAGAAGGVIGPSADTLLVGFERLPGFDAPAVADALAERGIPGSVSGVTVDFPAANSETPVAETYASMLDGDELVEGSAVPHTDEGEWKSAREALLETIRPYHYDEARVGLPAILGDRYPGEVRRQLESGLDATVFEVPSGPSGLGGRRLATLLDDRLEDAGVTRVEGSVVDATTDGDRAEAVTVAIDEGERTIEAMAFVLATGGVRAGGIRANRSTVRETVFDCPVAAPRNRADWSDDRILGDHPFARFGVRSDGKLRPVDGSGRPVFGNLRATGRVLRGYNPVLEHSRAGVAIATGYRAGRGSVGTGE